MMRTLAALAAVLALLVTDEAAAGPPTDQLRRSIDLVLQILADRELKTETKTAQRRAMIRTVADDIFDFTEISQRSLGRHWRERTPAEREQFVRLFGDLLEQTYIAKIESYSGETILYAAETTDADLAVVKTRIVTKQGTEIPVDYRMFQRNGRWRTYDVTIEGVSLVANYRSQFNAIIQRSGYPDLVAKLQAKQDERPGSREGGHREESSASRAQPRRSQSP
jgi:phospholipid transport system substrate-binding protein